MCYYVHVFLRLKEDFSVFSYGRCENHIILGGKPVKKVTLCRRLAAVTVIVLQIFLALPCNTQEAEASCPHNNPGRIIDEIIKDSTCTTTGIYRTKCTMCNTYLSGDKVLAKKSHNFSKLISDTATCKSKGVKTYQCKNCTETKTEESPQLNHNYVFDHKVEPTCSTSGSTVYKCSGCGTTRGDNIPPTGNHSYTVPVSDSATCTSGGTAVKRCANCSATASFQSSAIGHNFVFDHKVEPTCGKAGSSVSKCTRCGATRGENIEPTGAHKFTEVSNTATCTAAGKKTSKC
ncbi:MAG: hypothetical protein J5845_04515, partial [Lachnospiraceae bacterium]|nr:hypothetical protein [Lachnospiraceae bacterium]